jgi:glucan phosphoethanolaminetransferase (alkaline phosphatase superfamily)
MKKIGLTVLALVACVLVAVQLPLIRIEIPLPTAKIVPNSGYAYLFGPIEFNGPAEFSGPVFYLPGDRLDTPPSSSLLIFEDGKSLGPPHAPHESIRESGRGNFSHWYDQLVFSSSDNTDPRVNGRTYTATGVLRLAGPWRSWALLALAVTFAGMLMFVRAQIVSAVKRSLGKVTMREAIVPLAKLSALVALFFLSWRPFLTVDRGEPWFTTAAHDLGAFWANGNYSLSIYYGMALAIAMLGVCVTPFINDGRLRLPLAFLIVTAFMADAIMLNISGQNLTLDMVDTLWRERNVGVSTIGGYLDIIARLGALFAALLIVLAWRPNWAVARTVALVPFVAVIAMFGVVYVTHGATTASPPGISVPAQLAFVNVAGARVSGLRDPVAYTENPQPRFKKILFIVDESVRADYLGLNNPKLDNTPSLIALQPYMANFGIASAGANCSAAARLFLRIGLMPSELPDVAQVWSKKTTMWAYAKAAGFKTVLVEGHSPPAPLFHSYMDLSEAKSIDEIRQVADPVTYKRDHQMPAHLLELLSRDEPMFIAVNKFGVHPHYKDRMPSDFEYRSEHATVDTRLSAARSETASQYDRSLKWSVDLFFEALGSKIVRDDTLVIYTSDHGQAMFDGGYENQHCSLGERIANSEAFVPLFAVTHDKQFLRDMRDAASRFRDQASHFELFPTLLYAMGYPKSWIEKRYGPTLFDVPEHRQRGFLMGTFFNPGAKWLALGRDGFTTRVKR